MADDGMEAAWDKASFAGILGEHRSGNASNEMESVLKSSTFDRGYSEKRQNVNRIYRICICR